MASRSHGIHRIPWWLRKAPVEAVKRAVDKTPTVVPFMRPRELYKLPHHYQKAFWEKQIKKQKPVHYIPPTEAEQYRYDRVTGTYHHDRSDIPIEAVYPREADYGLWGGEGIVKGYFRKEKKLILRRPSWWWPSFQQAIFYSEILNRHMQFVVTDSAYDFIEKAGGIDHYILSTHTVDLKSRLGMRLKREMLVELARNMPLLANDPEKQQAVLIRYKQYIISEEEAEWVGLSLQDAVNKYEQSKYRTPIPMREVFRERVLLELKAEKDGLATLPLEAQALVLGAQQASAAAALEAGSRNVDSVGSLVEGGGRADSKDSATEFEKKSWWKKYT